MYDNNQNNGDRLFDYELKFMEIRMLGICVVIVILIFFSIFVTSREFLG